MAAPGADTPIRIGVSSCLLGAPVRFDGGHRRNPYLCDILAKRFEFVPLCPEVAAGLGIPRPPIELLGDPRCPRALGVDNRSLDVTGPLEDFARTWAQQLDAIAGLILKSRSPSCGIRDVPVYDADGNMQTRGPGLFTRILMEQHPLLPLEDESGIQDPARCAHFISRVRHYAASGPGGG